MIKTSWWQKAVLISLSVVLSVFAAEIVLRVIYPAPTKYFVWQPDIKHIFHADTSVLRGIQGISRFTINQYGVRTEQERINLFSKTAQEDDHNEKYILCIGGSTTECLYLDDSATWPAQIERLASNNPASNLKYVASIGKSGCTTIENYIQLKYCVSQYHQINTIICMVGFNDMLKHLAQDSLYHSHFNFSGEVADSLANTVLIKQGIKQSATWWRRTALFNLIQKFYRHQQPVDPDMLVQDDKAEIYKQWRKNRASALAILDSLPDMTSALNEFARNLNLMIDEAQRQQLGIIFVNQSALWKDDMSKDELSSLWMGGIGKYQAEPGHLYYSTAALQRGLEMYNAVLAKTCAVRKVHYVDLDSKLPHNADVFYDDCHFTGYGAALAGRIIYDEIK